MVFLSKLHFVGLQVELCSFHEVLHYGWELQTFFFFLKVTQSPEKTHSSDEESVKLCKLFIPQGSAPQPLTVKKLGWSCWGSRYCVKGQLKAPVHQKHVYPPALCLHRAEDCHTGGWALKMRLFSSCVFFFPPNQKKWGKTSVLQKDCSVKPCFGTN